MEAVTEKKTALLGTPGYDGQLAIGASRGFWRASSQTLFSCKYNAGSLLAQNFNGLWCWALNRVYRGQPVDYFAMLHADVEPEDFWLDKLIAELEDKKLDVLGVPLPIKDSHGLTSIALDRPDGDPWRPLCRLTLAEIHSLPETFTSDDVGFRILLNTGCWVCRFDPEWANLVHFTINDRIAFSTKHDAYVAEVEPEDWNMSRQFHRLGLKIGVTRKVQCNHVGATRFMNYEPWGTDLFDTAYLTESVLPDRYRPNKPEPSAESREAEEPVEV